MGAEVGQFHAYQGPTNLLNQCSYTSEPTAPLTPSEASGRDAWSPFSVLLDQEFIYPRTKGGKTNKTIRVWFSSLLEGGKAGPFLSTKNNQAPHAPGVGG